MLWVSQMQYCARGDGPTPHNTTCCAHSCTQPQHVCPLSICCCYTALSSLHAQSANQSITDLLRGRCCQWLAAVTPWPQHHLQPSWRRHPAPARLSPPWWMGCMCVWSGVGGLFCITIKREFVGSTVPIHIQIHWAEEETWPWLHTATAWSRGAPWGEEATSNGEHMESISTLCRFKCVCLE